MKDSRSLNILLAVALLVLVGGAVWGFMPRQSSLSASKKPHAQGRPPAILESVDSMLAAESEAFEPWGTPSPQSADGQWLFDVFTPPRIYINPETGAFEPTSYQFAREIAKPALSIIAVERPLFRHQLAGYIEASSGRLEDATLLVEDRETGAVARLKVSNDELLSSGHRLTQFDVEKTFNDRGAIQRAGKLDLLGNDGQRIVLRTDKPTYIDGYLVRVRYGENSFDFSEKQPKHSTEEVELVWNIDASEYPVFVFEIKNLTTSELETFRVESYLSSQ